MTWRAKRETSLNNGRVPSIGVHRTGEALTQRAGSPAAHGSRGPTSDRRQRVVPPASSGGVFSERRPPDYTVACVVFRFSVAFRSSESRAGGVTRSKLGHAVNAIIDGDMPALERLMHAE
ncbi:hypothetical protein LSAT2_007445 [Lamellibrachia satsuma]|nr:hypothetical protein LSAT2_007445 [Lamellibrachia satsuma]